MESEIGRFWPAGDSQEDGRPGQLFGQQGDWKVRPLPTVSIADFSKWRPRPDRTWHGVVGEEDEPVTLLRCQGVLLAGVDAMDLLRGAWVPDDSAPASSIRWVVDGAWPVQGAAECVVGTVSGWSPDAWRGVELNLKEPMPIREAVHVARRASTLWSLCSDSEVHMARVQVLVRDQWATWEERFSGKQRRRQLVPYEAIEARHVAVWIDELASLGPEPFMAIDQPTMPLEMQVFAFASALEGIHRRRFKKARGFDLKDAPRKSARDAARAAFELSLRDHGVAEEVVEQAMKRFDDSQLHFTDPTAKQRLVELLAPVDQLLPGLLGPKPADWANLLVKARNVQAHRLGNHDDFDEELQRGYVVLATTSQWALRTSLLLPVFGDELPTLLEGPSGWAVRDLMRDLDGEGFYESVQAGYSSAVAFESRYGDGQQ